MARGMELYLVRHAIAEERGPQWPDSKRPLTTRGIERFREVVAGLRALDLRLDVILTSPLMRARQTADLLAEGLDPSPRIDVLDALSPGATPQVVRAALARVRGGRVACVGHEPDLGAIAAHLVGAAEPFEFKKGGVCRIDLDRASGAGRLAWFAPPRLIRARR